MNQNAAISEAILIAFAATGSVRLAFDAVMGEGAYDKLAGELYDAIRAA